MAIKQVIILNAALTPKWEKEDQARCMDWYSKLSIDQKINVKDLFMILCGVEWGEFGFILPFPERIEIIYNKLLKVGVGL